MPGRRGRAAGTGVFRAFGAPLARQRARIGRPRSRPDVFWPRASCRP